MRDKKILFSFFFVGKPLGDVSTIRANIGDTLLKIYASESADYFTAGLLDGYVEPDAEMEIAMCRFDSRLMSILDGNSDFVLFIFRASKSFF